MPTESKTATKRATKKRRTKRASAAADEGLDDDGNAKTQRATKTPRKSTRKTTKARSKSVTTDDDFGSGLSDDEAPAKKTVKKKRKASAKKATSRKKSADDDSDVPAKKSAEKKPAAKKRKSTKKKKAAEPGDDFGAELEFESEAKEAVSEKPKRARRRKSSEDSSNDTDSGSRSARADRDSASDASESHASESDASDSSESSGGRSGRSRSQSGRSDRSRSESSNESKTSEGDSDSATAEGESANTEKSSSRDGDSDSDGNRRGRRRRGRRGRGRRGGSGGGEDRGPRNQRSGTGSGGGGGGNKRGRDRGPSKDIEPVSTHVTGVLEMHPKGYGFVRERENDYAAQETDPFVSTAFIDRYNLREGVLIAGEVGAGHRGQGPRLTSIEAIEGSDPEEYVDIKDFDRLTPINPEEHIKLEMGPSPVTTRVIDLLCPIGKGQRALIVAPPRSGKTILLQQMADAVAFNHPECHLMVMLIDERPEEVTEMRRHVKGEVVASSIDRDLENHVRVSQLVIERAKRLAEMGKDVFILLDSITRLARAFNKYTNTGRTGSGGIDVRAMDKPKKIFGSARVFDEGGSITVVGTALIQTGSRMDDVIFEEFKGTGNMELVLSRELADRRIWPAMDVEKSGTRREEKLLPPDVLEGVTMMRRSLISLHPVEAMEQLVRTLSKFDTNAEFLSRIRSVM